MPSKPDFVHRTARQDRNRSKGRMGDGDKVKSSPRSIAWIERGDLMIAIGSFAQDSKKEIDFRWRKILMGIVEIRPTQELSL